MSKKKAPVRKPAKAPEVEVEAPEVEVEAATPEVEAAASAPAEEPPAKAAPKPKVVKDPRVKYALCVVDGGETHSVIKDDELIPLVGGTLEDKHFEVPMKERPLWWHSLNGAQRVGERKAVEHGWDAVQAVEIRLPVTSGTRHASRVEAKPAEVEATPDDADAAFDSVEDAARDAAAEATASKAVKPPKRKGKK